MNKFFSSSIRIVLAVCAIMVLGGCNVVFHDRSMRMPIFGPNGQMGMAEQKNVSYEGPAPIINLNVQPYSYPSYFPQPQSWVQWQTGCDGTVVYQVGGQGNMQNNLRAHGLKGPGGGCNGCN